ncbi:9112_t:CDS:2, partial [Acaulospora colombiana]
LALLAISIERIDNLSSQIAVSIHIEDHMMSQEGEGYVKVGRTNKARNELAITSNLSQD